MLRYPIHAQTEETQPCFFHASFVLSLSLSLLSPPTPFFHGCRACFGLTCFSLSTVCTFENEMIDVNVCAAKKNMVGTSSAARFEQRPACT